MIRSDFHAIAVGSSLMAFSSQEGDPARKGSRDWFTSDDSRYNSMMISGSVLPALALGTASSWLVAAEMPGTHLLTNIMDITKCRLQVEQLRNVA